MNIGAKSKPKMSSIATYVFEAKGKLILREVKCWLKFTMKYKRLMRNLLLKQKLMKGRVEIGKGMSPLRKRELSEKERKICRKRQASALKVSQVRISTLS